MFNEIDGSYDDVAISTFKAGLQAEHDLRKSLTGKPVTSVRLLMDRIDKYRRISGRIGHRTIDLGETLQGSLDLPMHKQSMSYFESQCRKS